LAEELLPSLRVICIPGLNESASKVQRVLRCESLRKVFGVSLIERWSGWWRRDGRDKAARWAGFEGVLLVVIGA